MDLMHFSDEQITLYRELQDAQTRFLRSCAGHRVNAIAEVVAIEFLAEAGRLAQVKSLMKEEPIA